MALGRRTVNWQALGLLVVLSSLPFVVVSLADRLPEPVKVQVLLYPHVDHECIVDVYSDNTWVWTCDDGCYYKGAWRPDIEYSLACPSEDGNETGQK